MAIKRCQFIINEMDRSTISKGPAKFLAQFIGPNAPFNNLESICKWAKSLGFKGVQISTWDSNYFDLQKAAESKTYADDIKGKVNEAGLEITELSTHLQGQLVAVNPLMTKYLMDLHPNYTIIIQKSIQNGPYNN